MIRIPKLAELREAIRSFISKPVTVPVADLQKTSAAGFRGKPIYDEETCIGCGACASVCPASAIEVSDLVDKDPPVRRFTIHYDVCIFCGHCELNCTTRNGISNSEEFDLSTLDRRSLESSLEKELVLCSECGSVIATKDHILWVAEKLGPKQFAHPTLMLITDRELGLVEDVRGHTVSRGLRPDGIRAMCPRCRRTVLVREMWG